MARNQVADPIVQCLHALVEHSPDLQGAAGLYEIILPVLRDADLRVATVSFTPDQAQAKIAQGLPLLHDIELGLDNRAVQELTLRLASALENAGEDMRPKYRRIRLALEENRLDMSELLPHITANAREMFALAVQSLQLDPGLLWALAENVLKPAWRAWCRQLTSQVDVTQWNRGFCFICGACAIFGELRENHLVKHLRCGQCGADWPFRRLQCLYCGNEDHHTLGYLYAEPDHERMRAEVCETCKGYLKIIISFAPTPPDMLAVSDLSTLHLDYIAQERGYTRPPVQAEMSPG
jgi:formate dehydrogenase accessory protein FdhE